MIWMVGISVVGAISGCIYYLRNNNSRGISRVVDALSITIVIAVLGIVAGAGISLFNGLRQDVVWNPHREIQLVSLRTDSVMQGSFILATGSVGERWTYEYWYVDGDGYRHGRKYDTDNVKIIEDASPDTSYMVIQKKSCEDGDEGLWHICEWTDERRYIFHVPPGSVVREIKLD